MPKNQEQEYKKGRGASHTETKNDPNVEKINKMIKKIRGLQIDKLNDFAINGFEETLKITLKIDPDLVDNKFWNKKRQEFYEQILDRAINLADDEQNHNKINFFIARIETNVIPSNIGNKDGLTVKIKELREKIKTNNKIKKVSSDRKEEKKQGHESGYESDNESGDESGDEKITKKHKNGHPHKHDHKHDHEQKDKDTDEKKTGNENKDGGGTDEKKTDKEIKDIINKIDDKIKDEGDISKLLNIDIKDIKDIYLDKLDDNEKKEIYAHFYGNITNRIFTEINQDMENIDIDQFKNDYLPIINKLYKNVNDSTEIDDTRKQNLIKFITDNYQHFRQQLEGKKSADHVETETQEKPEAKEEAKAKEVAEAEAKDKKEKEEKLAKKNEQLKALIDGLKQQKNILNNISIFTRIWEFLFDRDKRKKRKDFLKETIPAETKCKTLEEADKSIKAATDIINKYQNIFPKKDQKTKNAGTQTDDDKKQPQSVGSQKNPEEKTNSNTQATTQHRAHEQARSQEHGQQNAQQAA